MVAELIRYRRLAHDIGRGTLQTRLEHGDIVRASRGVYSPAPPLDPDDRLRALFLRLPQGSALGFHSAAARHGFGVLRAERVHVVVPPGAAKPRIRGVVAHETALAAEPVSVAGVPCLPAARCAVDLARGVRRFDALPVLDAALRTGACSLDELILELERHRGLRGVRQARELIELADPRAECRQESQLRLVIIDGRLPVPEPQIWVGDAFSAHRYRLDLGYREAKVGLEYDGATHAERSRLRYDRARMNWLAAHGWTMRYFTDADLYGGRASIVATVREALLRR
jgi:hypothetical protein